MATVPTKVSHYRVESVLGEGGMGVVYLAEDELLSRRVALKFLPPALARDPDARRRFLAEGRAAAALNHPNAATLFEVGSDGEEMFLAMEYVPGPTLRELVTAGPLSWIEVLDMTLEILRALREAHAKGIVHRDIKGTNIKRTPEGLIKVMDFGLAKIAGGTTLTQRGSVMGTAAYMSPQQVVGDDVDGRADLFSLGVLMYELLTGHLPFTGDQEVAVAHAILHEDPITIRELAPEVPEELEHIVFKAMMKSVHARYQSPDEMIEDLVRFRDHDRRRRAGVHEELDLIATHEVYDVRREHFLAPLVGRDRPLARLRALHADARLSEGAAVAIAGEAGVGKTRLLEELRQTCRPEGTRVLTAACIFGGGTSPYYPFAEAFRQYFALRGVTSASTLQSFLFDRAPRLGGSLPVLSRFLHFTFATNGPTSEEELWGALDQLVAFIAEERPLVLVLEDMHWADEASIRLFHFLARRAPRRRELLIMTYRPEETVSEAGGRIHPLPAMLQLLSREDRFHRIELARLGRDDVAAILDRLYPDHAWGGDFPALLYRETEGNPFFMVELLKLLAAEGALAKRDGRWSLTTAVDKLLIPDKVYDVVMRRLSRLAERERDILELGAVEGDVFHSGTILRGLAIERMTLLKTLQFLEQAHHLIHAAGPHYHFDHSKIREILYNNISPELRIEYHTMVGQYLCESFGESEEHAGIIAHNLLSAGLKEQALPFMVRAAAAAARLFAYADGILFLNRAETVLHDLHPQNPPPERVRMLAEILHQRGDYEYAAGHYQPALASYEKALGLARATGEAQREADLLRAIGRTHYLLGRPAESRRHYDDAIANYEKLEAEARARGDDAAVARASRELGKIHFFKGDLERSQRYVTEAVRIAAAIGDARLHSASLNNLGGIHYQRGELERTLACHAEALAVRERERDEIGLAQSHKNLGIAHYRRGQMDEAARHLDEALALYRKVADRRGEAVTLRHLGILHYERGDHAGARRHWEASLSLCRELGESAGLSSCLNNLGYLHFEQGRYATCERLYQEALEVTAALGSRTQLVTRHVNLAELALSLDRLDRAEAELRQAEAYAREANATAGLAVVHRLRARIAAERGDIVTGRDEARAAMELTEPMGHVENLIGAELAAAEVELAAGAFADARRHAQRAGDTARWAHMAHFELNARLLAAQAAWQHGDGEAAARELVSLEPRAEVHGFLALAARAHDLLGQIREAAEDTEGAAAEYVRAGEHMKEILGSLSEEDRRSFVHHPEWKAVIGNLLDTLMRLGRREEALGYLVPLGVGVCEVEPGRARAVDVAATAR
jgi:tetratricopeptide (TPR) repeat protein/predicted Ser/Thr protein kinase